MPQSAGSSRPHSPPAGRTATRHSWTVACSPPACHNDRMATDLLHDYRWLVSEEAAPWLEHLRGSATPLVAQTRQLRQSFSAARTHLLLEQVQLRRRAAAKFETAERMFFTARALEQATDQWIAAYKAARFPRRQALADLCCGIGGDLFGLAQSARVTGVDADPVHALLAEANCRAIGLASPTIATTDATTFPLEDYAAWHIDPDRRSEGQRTTRLADSQPSLDALEGMRRRHGHGAIKLAPASVVPPHWAALAERQWIGSGRECRQQVVWFGELARDPGQHSAQVVHHGDSDGGGLCGLPGADIDTASHIAEYVFEPHAAVLAAQLTGTLAARYGLLGVDATVAYLTSHQLIEDPLLSCFAVVEVFPFDIRKLRRALQARQIGQLEVKKRGVPLDPDTLRQQLKGAGDESATLLITPHAGSVRAILCRRAKKGSGLFL